MTIKGNSSALISDLSVMTKDDDDDEKLSRQKLSAETLRKVKKKAI